MQVSESGEFYVKKSPQEVVEVLKNPEAAAKLIPGVSGVVKSGDEYTGTAAVRLGHLSGKMQVRFRYEKVDQNGVVVVGRATGLQTTTDFRIHVDVAPHGDGSLVKWRFEGNARGLIASLAPSVVSSTLKKMAEETVKNFAEFLRRA